MRVIHTYSNFKYTNDQISIDRDFFLGGYNLIYVNNHNEPIPADKAREMNLKPVAEWFDSRGHYMGRLHSTGIGVAVIVND